MNDPDLLTPLPLTTVVTHTSAMSDYVAEPTTKQKIIRAARVTTWILLWWLGSAWIFTISQPEWAYFDAVYFSFVTMTGIGYGDLRVRTPVAVEYWYVFLFNAV